MQSVKRKGANSQNPVARSKKKSNTKKVLNFELWVLTFPFEFLILVL